MENYSYVLDLIENNNEDIFVKEFGNIISNSDEYEINNIFFDTLISKIIIKNNLLFNNYGLIAWKVSDIYPLLFRVYDMNPEYVKSNIETIIFYQFDTNGYIASSYTDFFDFCKYIKIDLNYITNYLAKNNIPLTNSFDAVSFIIKTLLEDEYYNKDLTDNLDYFIDNTKYLLNLKSTFKKNNMSNEAISKINTAIDKNPTKVILEMMNEKINVDKLKDEKILDFLKCLIDELLEYEHKNYHDIETLKPGAYSSVYKIGRKIIKLGGKRETFKIRNDKRILKPLIRQEIYSIKDPKKFLFCVEVTEQVNVRNLSLEDVYSVYKDLRDRNIVWTDCKIENIGRLNRDNKIYYWGINFVSKNTTGYIDDNEEVLKAGELVVIDSDHMYDADKFFKEYDEYKTFVPSEYFADFESRYKYERSKAIKN